MKWHSQDIKPEKGRWVIYCWPEEDSFVFTVHEGEYGVAHSNCGYPLCWAYLDIEDFLSGKITTKSLPQYTGKRLISI